MMSKNFLQALQQKELSEFVGGSANVATLLYLQYLADLLHQMSCKNSKPFKTKQDIYIAQPELYQLSTAIHQTIGLGLNYRSSFSYDPNQKIMQHISFLFQKIIHILNNSMHIDPAALNLHPNRMQVCSFFEQLWNETRGFATSTTVINNLAQHERLIQTQCTENSRIVSRLLRTHEQIQVTKLSYLFEIGSSSQTVETRIIEQGLVRLKADLISEIQKLNPNYLFCTQWRIQRTLYGQYYLNMLIYHDANHSSLHIPQGNLSQQLNDTNDHLIQLVLSNPITGNLQVSKNALQGYSLADWKELFKIMVSPLKYYYYQSRKISPSFNNIIY